MSCTCFQFGNIIFHIYHENNIVSEIKFRFIHSQQFYNIENLQVLNQPVVQLQQDNAP
jgi:hypothetical protein